jgi:TPR repeat protein
LIPGYEGEVDMEMAAKLYKRAADLDCLEAMTQLGYFYENGIVFQKDISKAIEYYHKAALEVINT